MKRGVYVASTTGTRTGIYVASICVHIDSAIETTARVYIASVICIKRSVFTHCTIGTLATVYIASVVGLKRRFSYSQDCSHENICLFWHEDGCVWSQC